MAAKGDLVDVRCKSCRKKQQIRVPKSEKHDLAWECSDCFAGNVHEGPKGPVPLPEPAPVPEDAVRVLMEDSATASNN